MREVKQLRLAQRWTQTELAFHAGLAPSVISEIENGKRDPSAGTLRKLANALGVGVADLFPKAQLLPLEVFGASEWETAAAEFEAFQATAGQRLNTLLRGWQAEKEARGDSRAARAARRPHLDNIAGILDEAARHRNELILGISAEGNLVLERFFKAQEADGLLQDLRKQVADAGLYLYDGEDVRRARVEEAPAA